jgi:hypothetical protein
MGGGGPGGRHRHPPPLGLAVDELAYLGGTNKTTAIRSLAVDCQDQQPTLSPLIGGGLAVDDRGFLIDCEHEGEG